MSDNQTMRMDDERRAAIARLLAPVPERKEPQTPAPRWIVSVKKKSDPDSLY